VKDTDRKENRSSNEETPEALSKTGEDVGKPGKATQQSDKFTHHASFTNKPSAFK